MSLILTAKEGKVLSGNRRNPLKKQAIKSGPRGEANGAAKSCSEEGRDI